MGHYNDDDMMTASRAPHPVSYTHLDVYKRQHLHWSVYLNGVSVEPELFVATKK